MMDNKILITFLAIDIIFLLTGGLMLAVGIIFMPSMTSSLALQTDVGTRLLIQNTPLTGEKLSPIAQLHCNSVQRS